VGSDPYHHDLPDEDSQISDRRELVAALLWRNTPQRGFQAEANELKYLFDDADRQRRGSVNPGEQLHKRPHEETGFALFDRSSQTCDRHWDDHRPRRSKDAIAEAVLILDQGGD
jgi:hypothetical protein